MNENVKHHYSTSPPQAIEAIEKIQESLRELEVAARRRGARTWRGPKTPDTPLRKKARRAQKAARKVNR